MKIYTPANWPLNAPKYDSPGGWEYHKLLARKQVLTEASTLPYVLLQAEASHKAGDYPREKLCLGIALRLAELIEYQHTHLIAAMIVTVSAVCDALDSNRRAVGTYGDRKAFIFGKRRLIHSETWN
jgi:hypothetical protein